MIRIRNSYTAAIAGAASLGAALTIWVVPAVANRQAAPPVDALGAVSAIGGAGISKVPPAIQSAAGQISENAGIGNVLLTQTHRLAGPLGAGRSGLYAFPTTKGAVCFVVTEAVSSSSCVSHFDRSTVSVGALAYVGPEAGVPLSVVGLAPNSVHSIAVIVNGVPHAVAISRNAFFYQAPAGTPITALEAIFVRFDDGTITRTPF